MSVPFTSVDAATTAGPGLSRDLGEVTDRHTLFVWTTGGPACGMALEGSHDDVHWFQLVTFTSSVGTNGPFALTVPSPSHPDSHMVRYVRANITSLTGGTSPTVTATIASDVEES